MDEKPEEKEMPETGNEEELSADGAAAQAEVMLEGARQQRETDNKSARNKLLLALLVIILGIVGAVLVLSGGSDEAPSTEEAAPQTNSSEESQTQEVAAADTFDQLVYAHSSTANAPRAMFTRPVTGGDREPTGFDFGRQDFLNVDRDMGAYVVAAGSEVYYGLGSEDPTLIYTSSTDVAGVALDARAGSVLIVERDFSSFTSITTTLTVVQTDGSGSSEFFVDANADGSAVIYAEAWDGTNNVLFMRRSCTQCDGYNPELSSLDSSGNETVVFTPTVDSNQGFSTTSGYSFNPDRTSALYVSNTIYDNSNPFGIAGGIGGPEGAPFTLNEIDLTDGTSQTVVTFGEPEDVSSDGFFNAPRTSWTTIDGNDSIVYSYQKLLFVQNNSGNFDNYFETGQGDIVSIYFVDDNEVLVGGQNSEGETISYYNIDTQSGAIVAETLFTTTILGLTFK